MGDNINFQYVFVILTYRNSKDLVSCINSIQTKISNYKVIVINSYYDDESKNEIKEVTESHGCDFFNIPNKGYSAGNNYGIEKAKNYHFQYLIICNPDIELMSFPGDIQGDVIAPDIVTLNGKHQNPMYVVYNPLSEKLIYTGFKKNSKGSLVVGIGINKIIRQLYLLLGLDRINQKIYEPHGSFIILSNNVIDKIDPIFDENMFLFAEENVVAYKLRKYGFRVIYRNDIKIKHHEDGSMKISDVDIHSEIAKSNIYFYEHYRLNNK